MREIIWKKLEPDADDILAGISIRMSAREELSQYVSNHVEITVTVDGAIHFSDVHSENFIYFYPDQLKHLRTAVGLALKQAHYKGRG